MSISRRAMVTFLWLVATIGVFIASAVMGAGIAKEVVLVAGLSMALTFLALLFLLVAEVIAPNKTPAR